jgi:hypothetical protein
MVVTHHQPAPALRASPGSDEADEARRPHRGLTYERGRMSAVLWIIFATLYLMALFFLGLATLRKGHNVLFWVGIFFPFLWIIGAVSAPTDAAVRAEARASRP